MAWLRDYRSWSFGSDAIVPSEQVELDDDQAIELMTIRRAEIVDSPNGSQVKPPNVRKECDGIGLWLLPEPLD